MGIQLEYNRQSTREVDEFVTALKSEAKSEGGTFDSVSGAEFIGQHVSGADGGLKIPSELSVLFDEIDSSTARQKITLALLDGISTYEHEHGVAVPADVVEQAFHNAWCATAGAQKMIAFDSATSSHSDNMATQANRAIVSINTTIASAVPFAGYLPFDIGSGKAILAIVNHTAANHFGGYAIDGLMDGASSGDSYLSAIRTHVTTSNAGAHTGQLTSVQATFETCAPVAGDVVPVKLLRGRTKVYIAGRSVAMETNATGTGNSTVSGSVIVGGTTHQIGGTVNTDTGVIALTSTPALADNVPVVVEGIIDYQRSKELIPSIIIKADPYELYATPWQGKTHATIDSRTQMINELGLDPVSESIAAIQIQQANERHYRCLRLARRLGLNNVATFAMDWANQGLAKTRAEVWQDFASTLGVVDQQMAIDTMSYGIGFLYVGSRVAKQLLSMPRELFEPSGLRTRPGIFRLGRLFGTYEVYYTPKGINESGSTSEILCIGQSIDVARSPIVLGDAVPVTIRQTAESDDLTQNAGFYARNFTDVNPHTPSSSGCALITVTGMGL